MPLTINHCRRVPPPPLFGLSSPPTPLSLSLSRVGPGASHAFV